MEDNPDVSLTSLSFEMIEFAEDVEVRVLVNVAMNAEGAPAAPRAFPARAPESPGAAGEAVPVISKLHIVLPLLDHTRERDRERPSGQASPTALLPLPAPTAPDARADASMVQEPRLTTKNIQVCSLHVRGRRPAGG
jgi:hypothetical protein